MYQPHTREFVSSNTWTSCVSQFYDVTKTVYPSAEHIRCHWAVDWSADPRGFFFITLCKFISRPSQPFLSHSIDPERRGGRRLGGGGPLLLPRSGNRNLSQSLRQLTNVLAREPTLVFFTSVTFRFDSSEGRRNNLGDRALNPCR